MKPKVIVVMPAYYAEKTLEKTYKDIPKDLVSDIILVDDCSKDRTAEIAVKLGLHTVVHPENKGYGANQKTCYTEALKKNPDIVIMVHPDYQYDPKKIPEFIKAVENGADVVVGSRMKIRGSARNGGMPLFKRVSNFLLTKWINFTLGLNLTDGASGYVAYTGKVLETIPFLENSDWFTFDIQALMQSKANKFKIAEVFIPTKYEDDSSSINYSNSIKFGSKVWFLTLKYKLGIYPKKKLIK